MSTITIPKTQYRELKKKADAYEYILHSIEEDIFSPPPIKSAKKILSELKRTGRYNNKFLESLEKGLSHSSYFKK